MKRLSKAEILQKNTVKTREVEIEEWGGSVLIRSLNAYTVLKLKESVENGKPTDDYYFYLVALSVVEEEDGVLNPVYTLEQAKEIDSVPLNRILIEIVDLNNLDPNAVKKSREELKNVLKDNSSSN